jgi:AraC family transcriptional regulator
MQLTRVSSNADFPKLWEAFSRRVDEVKPMAGSPILAYGVCSNFDTEKNQFDYCAGLAVTRTDQIPDGMALLKIPEQEYAVFECTLPTLMETIKKINSEHLPNSQYRRAKEKPELEEYDPAFDPTIPESKMLVYVPVEGK